MFSMLLVDSFELATVALIEKPTLQASSVPRSQRGRTNSLKDIPQYELDLHIENLDPNYKARKFSNAEILQIQLDQLRRNLALAIMHRMERMIVIHGLGRGILRDAVHQVLKETPEVRCYRGSF
jgi:DNA-nicking Smr family endonuclease